MKVKSRGKSHIPKILSHKKKQSTERIVNWITSIPWITSMNNFHSIFNVPPNTRYSYQYWLHHANQHITIANFSHIHPTLINDYPNSDANNRFCSSHNFDAHHHHLCHQSVTVHKPPFKVVKRILRFNKLEPISLKEN